MKSNAKLRLKSRLKRHFRIRKNLKGTPDRPRLARGATDPAPAVGCDDRTVADGHLGLAGEGFVQVAGPRKKRGVVG